MLYEIVDEQGKLNAWSIPSPTRSTPVVAQPVTPLRLNESAPLFRLNRSAGVWNATLGSQFIQRNELSLADLVHERPLVLSFYCPCWNSYAPRHLAALRDVYQKVRGLGGDLLVMSNEPTKALSRLAEHHQLPFSLAYDIDHEVAKLFGVYSEDAPVWQRVAGISDDVFTPAVYVIGRNRRIAYEFVDENFDQEINTRALLDAVYRLKG